MTIILEWHGPFNSMKLYKIAPQNAFYVIKGKEPYKRKALVHFKGLCKTPFEATGKVRNVTRERSYYFCKPAAAAPAQLGDIMKVVDRLFSDSYRDPDRRALPQAPYPTVPVTLIMHYFKRNGERRTVIPTFNGSPGCNVWHWDTRGWCRGRF